jgi:DNA-binding response OmpR family regulator
MSGAQKQRILFLEDEVILTMTFESVLEELQLGEVVTVHSLEAAHREIDEAAFTIAVLDFNIDGKPSVEIAERIIAEGGRVVFATGHAASDIHVSGFPFGVITKPYQEAALRKAVLEACRQLSEADVSKKAAGF